MTSLPSIAFHVFGCRLNQAEASEWQSALTTRGFPLASREATDILCVHSCAVTEPATHEVLKFLRAYRKKHPQTRIILSGCATELVPPELADLHIPHAEKATWVTRTLTFLQHPSLLPTTTPIRTRTRTSLIIQDGCDRFCAYCIVPYLRGAPTSVPMRQLLQDAEQRFAQGYREIVLTGCHLALYRDPDSGADFVELLKRLCDVPGEGRFRIGSLEPCILDERALIQTLATHPERLCAFLHLPIQTASDTLLKAMGRTYTQADVRGLLDQILSSLPNCGLGADWIVGLPGERNCDAEATCQLLADYPFTGAHIFPYSPRPGTRAATFANQIPSALLKQRVDTLTQVAHEVKRKTLRSFIGQPMMVIPERQREGLWEGWSAQRFRCRLPGDARRGQLTPFTPSDLQDDCFI